MKSVAVFDMRDFDEAEWFEKYSQELGLTLSTCPDAPDMENIARVTEGCECVDIITSQITREMMEEFAKSGIRYITTRTIGYDHIDLEAAKEFGIHVGNARKVTDCNPGEARAARPHRSDRKHLWSVYLRSHQVIQSERWIRLRLLWESVPRWM